MSAEVARVAIVTGAAQGIGKSIALRLAEDGLDVVVNDIPSKSSELDSVKAAVEAKGRKSLAVVGDISSEADVIALVEKTVSALGGLDVMVANAGILFPTPLVDLPVSEWDRIFNINARGTFLCYRHAAKQMIKQGRGGRIIGAASSASKQGIANLGHYSASKFAVRGLTQSAALEWGAHKITVNSYAPSTVETPMVDNFVSSVGAPRDAFYAGQSQLSAVGYHGQPEYIADLVSFLASKGSHHITETG
ncbi:Short-chain dehydrogenase [Psilocybe cubensis]|uniref:Short-chain dehydrogenase n=1 Tax=Psilocybe cubensis TaxID=181762 RepID=A0ACB8GPM9_PSICU|nr:Short-chain dehydrogenase [Psilocybe cubensis]KAH9477362.1 Short-chain dehydrogenase [Psilocybe cubensis]